MFIGGENEEDFKQALMLLESLSIFQQVSYKDKTTEFSPEMKSKKNIKILNENVMNG